MAICKYKTLSSSLPARDVVSLHWAAIYRQSNLIIIGRIASRLQQDPDPCEG